ncbi:class I SAM-dependent methyltransferase [Flammeovirga sp. MY04]|uniref:class I SAM-dependent methyltransferase n=1 Tax=Flammeovirga sp. MY04 TaxID=1191459 RepID=UPI0008064184|nr:class I SAM-dependent methyltransferase [Flammeovirga sp. MY04]ANQ47749.1 class I SAM-dependent methyltransferase [Flammeovirga sp. MY04]
MKANQFDHIAKVYDLLASFVFGKKIIEIQQRTFYRLPKNKKVLIIGGGTGKIIPYIEKKLQPAHLVFLDYSKVMIELAQKVDYNGRIEFINNSYEVLFEQKEEYDIIITNFFLDVLTPPQLSDVLPKISNLMKDDGYWVVSDFRIDPHPKKRYFHWALHKTMVLFFKVTANLKNTQLPNYIKEIEATKLYKKRAVKYAYFDMMFTALFSKK